MAAAQREQHFETQQRGRAAQVDPIKPILKPPVTKHLKLKCDILLSTLLSNSTCAATTRCPQKPIQRRRANHLFEVGSSVSQGNPSMIRNAVSSEINPAPPCQLFA